MSSISEQIHRLKVVESVGDLLSRCNMHRTLGRRNIVLTTGAFDVLHEGHFAYLEHARSLGDVLVVGINDDNFVRKIKGPNRPYYNQGVRALNLSQLSCVNVVYVFSFEEQVAIIEAVSPKIFVMSDSSHRTPDERREQLDKLESIGSEIVVLAPFSDVHSTDLIKQLRGEK